ncbi:MAG: thioredoxin family protein [Candidatus Zixiibacteriota bacterium]
MKKRTIEVFIAGCPACDETVNLVKSLVCTSCELQILDMRTNKQAQIQAKKYGIKRVPTVVIDGEIAECCQLGAVDEKILRNLGVGTQL